MSNSSDIKSLIKEHAGQANIIAVPKAFIDILDGDWNAAIVLAQCVYWSDKGKSEWFYKSYSHWKEEIGLSQYQVSRAIKKLSPLIKTKKLMAKGSLTLYYKVEIALLRNLIMKKLDNEETKQSHYEETKQCIIKKLDSPLKESTETTHKTTTETTYPLPTVKERKPTKKKKAPSPTTLIKAKYIQLLGHDVIAWTAGEGKAAKQIGERWTIDQLEASYRHYKSQDFWSDKILTLGYLAKNLPAFLQGGHKQKGAQHGQRRGHNRENGSRPGDGISQAQREYAEKLEG